MNNIGNLDYSINTTVKDNKLIIEYNGSVFKDNPSLVTKRTNNVMVRETPNGFKVEMDLKRKNDLNFSVNNVNNEEVKNEVNVPLSLILPKKLSVFGRIKLYFKKIKLLHEQNKEIVERINENNN